MNRKYKIVIIAVSITAVMIAGVIYLSLSYLFKEDEKHLYIEFLNVSKHETDSVLNTLSIDDLIDKLVISCDSGSALQLVYQQRYIDAINDSTSVSNILLNTINNKTKSYLFSLNKYELNGVNDSTYVTFILNKYDLYKNILKNKNILYGFKISENKIINLHKQATDTNSYANYLYEEIANKADIVLVDSFGNIDNNMQVDGILAGYLDEGESSDNQLINKLSANVNLFCTYSEQKPKLKLRIKKLIEDDKYSETALRDKIRKIVKLELWQNRHNISYENCDTIRKKLMPQYLAEKSMCLLNNQDSVMPLKNSVYNRKFLVIHLGKKINKLFKNNLEHYINASYFSVSSLSQAKRLTRYKKYNTVFFVDTLLNDSVLQSLFHNVIKYGMRKNSIIVNMSNLENLKQIPDSFACLQTQYNNAYDYKLAAQAIFGGVSISGILPYKLAANYKFASGFKTDKIRLKYTLPEDADIDAEKMGEIDKIAYEGISRGAFPGCQIFVARQGKVIYNKSFGFHSYAKRRRLRNNDIFDLASVTKIAATTMAAMKMNSDKSLTISDKLSRFFKDKHIDYTRIKPDTIVNIDTFETKLISNWKSFLEQNDTVNINDSLFTVSDTVISKLTPKRNIFKVRLIDLLKHKSGISPAVPIFRYIYYKTYFLKELEKQDFYKDMLSNVYYKKFNVSNQFPDSTNLPDSIKTFIKHSFSNIYDEYFTKNYIVDTSLIELSNNQYFKQCYFDTIWRDIKQIPVFSHKVSQYSDLNMVLLQMAIDSLNKESIDRYLKRKIYRRLGLQNITYLPLRYSSYKRIVPTEVANNWRHGLLKGLVHDPSAALLGGVAGNAGLFSNAEDLGVLFQMLLNKGQYGGQQFIKPAVISKFTKRQDDTQRALGFDMPNRKAVVGSKASKNTYGHSGYTGTCVWVDPDNELVYVFLSNRNHPTSKNWKIVKHKIRERIHNAVYDAILKE